MELKNTKLEMCKKCWGTGNVHGGDENSTWSKTCADCHGIGFVRVPMTNADRIRSMSDEELEWAIDPAIVPPGMSKREWLKQPAE